MRSKLLSKRYILAFGLVSAVMAGVYAASETGGTQGNLGGPVAVLGEMGIVLLLAKIGGHVAIRLGQPAVLGELGAGMAVGAFLSLGAVNGYSVYLLDAVRGPDSHLHVLAQMGVVLLLYRVGLESHFSQLLENGFTAALVAITGIVLPVIGGAAVCFWFGAESKAGQPEIYLYLFVGATMAATSVGMTARVFDDLGLSESKEANIVLGSAVIDDVLGLLVFAVISSLVFTTSGDVEASLIGSISGVLWKTAVFFLIVAALGRWLVPPVFRALLRMRGEGVGVAIALSFCFGMAYLSNAFQLATVVGAFLAGLMIDNRYFPRPEGNEHGRRLSRHQVEQLIDPLYQVLAPVFFVILGMQVRFNALADWKMVWYAIALVVVALTTKIVAGLWVRGPMRSRMIVGVGMIPRGEVGLIFASMGLASGVFGEATYGTLVLTVFATTLVTPPALKLLTRPPATNDGAGFVRST